MTLPNGIKVSRIAHGCEPLGGTDWGRVDAAEAIAAVKASWDSGVTVFDTAPVYGLGLSEERLAEALGPERRNAFIVSKFGLSWRLEAGSDRATVWRDASPASIAASVEQSLRRLKLDSLPLGLLHWPDPRTPIEETMSALERLSREGKLQAVGLSNAGPELIRQAHAALPLAAVELEYSLIRRDAETDAMGICSRLGIPVFAYGPLGQGLLTGKYPSESEFGKSDRRSRLPHFDRKRRDAHRPLMESLSRVARRSGRTVSQVALRWVLDRPGTGVAVVGAKTASQARSNCAAADWSLSADELDSLTRDSEPPTL